jgi:hypothetical protein
MVGSGSVPKSHYFAEYGEAPRKHPRAGPRVSTCHSPESEEPVRAGSKNLNLIMIDARSEFRY